MEWNKPPFETTLSDCLYYAGLRMILEVCHYLGMCPLPTPPSTPTAVSLLPMVLLPAHKT
jgi:hypothetical protein